MSHLISFEIEGKTSHALKMSSLTFFKMSLKTSLERGKFFLHFQTKLSETIRKGASALAMF